MRGSTLVKGIRGNVAVYPNLCRMHICLYDEYDQEHTGTDAEFAEDLFINNPAERKRFIETLNNIDNLGFIYMDVKITESHVILFYQTPKENVFCRRVPFETLDIS